MYFLVSSFVKRLALVAGLVAFFSGFAIAQQAVLTGNFGNDLTLLIKAAKEVGFESKFYTFYGNALGVP